jgi:Ca2+-binding RTX toxin-like protein
MRGECARCSARAKQITALKFVAGSVEQYAYVRRRRPGARRGARGPAPPRQWTGIEEERLTFMQRKFTQQIWLTCVLISSLVGCSKKAPSEGDAGMGEMPPDDEPMGGDDGSGTNAGGSSGSNAMKGDAAVYSDMPLPEFEGIPTDGIPYGKAPKNCSEKGTNEGDTLVLQMDAMIRGMLLTSKDGVLQVNGVKCNFIAAPKSITIKGTTAAETAIIDFSFGDLPDSLHGATINVDLGTGTAKDVFALATLRDEDVVHLGMLTGAAMVNWTDHSNFKLTNVESVIVSTGPGNDLIDATGGGDFGTPLTLPLAAYAGAGDDALQGGMGADGLHGGEGDDMFRTASSADGADVYDGGPGTDTVSYENRTNPLTIKVDKMPNDGEMGEKDDVQDTMETLIGGSAADVITGGDADNTIIGGLGNDILNGGAGQDMFVETEMQQGADVMNGGPGFDTVDYSERANKLVVTLCIPTPLNCVTGICNCPGDDGEADERDALVFVENVYGGRGDDVLNGSSEDNVFIGNEGNDVITGLEGDDTIYAGDGNDKMYGGPGDDLLSGDMGADTFDGGDGQGDICIFYPPEVPLNCELK